MTSLNITETASRAARGAVAQAPWVMLYAFTLAGQAPASEDPYQRDLPAARWPRARRRRARIESLTESSQASASAACSAPRAPDSN